MDIVTATKLAFLRAFDYNSRASRSEYWWYQVSYFIMIIIAEVVGYAVGLYDLLYFVAEVALLVPAISLAVRRLHDIGMSGWWNLIAISIIGLIPLIIWYATPGHKGVNKFGKNPLEIDNNSNDSYTNHGNHSFKTSPVTSKNYRSEISQSVSKEGTMKKQKTKNTKGFKTIKKI